MLSTIETAVCRFPGCECRFCDAHHVQHWADGGETRLDNLLLLCRSHHRAVHEEGFGVALGDGGEATFSWPDGRPFETTPRPPEVASFVDFVRRARVASGDRADKRSNLPSWDGAKVDFRLALECLRRE